MYSNLPAFRGIDLGCFRGGRAVFAGLNFSVNPGEALILLGPNGSGKSSLLRVMAGLLKPSFGSLAWGDVPVSDDPQIHSGRSHYIGHHDAIKPVLSVTENLRFWGKLQDPDAGMSHVEAAMQAFTLTHLRDIPGKMLSAGQKRRTNLARLLAAPSPLWLMDEPTTALDKKSVKDLEAIMAEHRAKGGMVILSTHMDVDLPGARELHLDQFTPAMVEDDWSDFPEDENP